MPRKLKENIFEHWYNFVVPDKSVPAVLDIINPYVSNTTKVSIREGTATDLNGDPLRDHTVIDVAFNSTNLMCPDFIKSLLKSYDGIDIYNFAEREALVVSI